MGPRTPAQSRHTRITWRFPGTNGTSTDARRVAIHRHHRPARAAAHADRPPFGHHDAPLHEPAEPRPPRAEPLLGLDVLLRIVFALPPAFASASVLEVERAREARRDARGGVRGIGKRTLSVRCQITGCLGSSAGDGGRGEGKYCLCPTNISDSGVSRNPLRW